MQPFEPMSSEEERRRVETRRVAWLLVTEEKTMGMWSSMSRLRNHDLRDRQSPP